MKKSLFLVGVLFFIIPPTSINFFLEKRQSKDSSFDREFASWH